MLINIALASMVGEPGAVRAGAAGTLAHALAYHSNLRTPSDAEQLARNIVTASSPDLEVGAELRELAAAITRMLEELTRTG